MPQTTPQQSTLPRAVSRFDVERAIMRSDLSSKARHVLMVLCTRIDQHTGAIPSQWQPSLSMLARDTGLWRRTVQRALDELERLGWVTRLRPTKHDARTLHARTRYTVRIGRNQDGTGLGTPPAEGAPATVVELGTQVPKPRKARDVGTQDLGTQEPEAGDTVAHSSSPSRPSTMGEEIAAVKDAIEARTGARVDTRWAHVTRLTILGDRPRPDIHDRPAYLRTVIMNAPVDTYRPTPIPPPFRAGQSGPPGMPDYAMPA